MIKKIIPVIVCLCLFFCIDISANPTDSTNTDTPAVTEDTSIQDSGRQAGGMGSPPWRGNMQNNEMPSDMPDGGMPPDMPYGGMPPDMPNGVTTPDMSDDRIQSLQNSENTENENGQQTSAENGENTSDTIYERPNRMPRDGMGDGMNGMYGRMQENTQTTESAETQFSIEILNFIKIYSTPITSLILLALAFIFVIFYKRKNY